MTTLQKYLALVAGGLAALVLAFAAGRWTAAGSAKELLVEREAARVGDLQASDRDTRRVVRRTVTRRDSPGAPPAAPGQPCPACPPVHEETTVEETVDETSDEEATAHLEERTREVVRQVEAARPRLALEARVAVPLRLPVDRPSRWGLEGQVRVAGPVWVGLGYAQEPPTAGEKKPTHLGTAAVRVEF